MTISNLIYSTIYFLLPAYFANMAPVIAFRLNLWPQLNHPIDNNHKLWGQQILGSGKTWRGLVSGFIGALIICCLQAGIQSFGWLTSWGIIDFQTYPFIAVAALAAIGALGGDLVKSFLKRRFKISSGQPWPIFDQLDFILGYLLIMMLVVPISVRLFWAALLITLVLHPMTNIASYWLKLKKVWW